MKHDLSDSSDSVDAETPVSKRVKVNTEAEMMNIPALIILLIITLFCTPSFFLRSALQVTTFLPVPPVGVLIVGGCGPDLLFNILFTILGYKPFPFPFPPLPP